MIIGLVRHFKVDLPFQKSRYLPSEFNEQMKNYDSAPVIPNDIKMKNYEWEVCYSSDLPRAVTTAGSVFNNEIIQTVLLREVPLTAFMKQELRLPAFIWHIGGRIAWRRNSKSQPETYLETRKRIDDLYTLISTNSYSKVLIVTHGFFMRLFTDELKKKGFTGEIDVSPKNGKLYVFSNEK